MLIRIQRSAVSFTHSFISQIVHAFPYILLGNYVVLWIGDVYCYQDLTLTFQFFDSFTKDAFRTYHTSCKPYISDQVITGRLLRTAIEKCNVFEVDEVEVEHK